MDPYQNVLKRALQHDLLITIAFIIVIIVVVILLSRLIKKEILPKWTLLFSAVGVVLLIVGSIKTCNIYSEMVHQNYVMKVTIRNVAKDIVIHIIKQHCLTENRKPIC